MEYRLLGPLSVTAHGAEVDIPGLRERTTLSVLLLERNRMVSVDRLIDAVWESPPPASARSQVHNCISGLRRRFAAVGEPDVIETRRSGYLARVGSGQVDLDRFAALTATGRTYAAAGQVTDAADRFAAALELWRGSVLADIDSRAVRYLTVGLTDLHLAASEDWLDALLASGRHDEVCRSAAALVARHPLRERLRGLQMTALYRAGRTSEALDVYRRAREVLVAELGVEPGPALRQLHRAVLTHDEQVWEAPPMTVVPRQLPAAPGGLTGRDEIAARLRARLSGTATVPRVIGLTGPAGVGKTALALHVAHAAAADFPDGQLYVDLHGLVGVDHVLGQFLRSLGVAGSAVPDSCEERAALYRSLVAGRRLLVVIDGAADENQVRPLLPGTPGCATVVTSRRWMAGLDGADRVEVGVLPAVAAVDLLSASSRRPLDRDAPAARRLVELCGGLPLALRIAAIRLIARPHWTVTDLVNRMVDEGRRLDELAHGGLAVRPSLSLSYNGLGEPTRRLYRRLGLLKVADFPAWVAAPLLDGRAQAVDVLEELVDARLVEVGAGADGRPRYRMHELPRVFARERLADDENPADRRAALARLTGLVLSLAEEAHRRVNGGGHTVPALCVPVCGPSANALLAEPTAWLERERDLIVAAQAARLGLAEVARDLPVGAARSPMSLPR